MVVTQVARAGARRITIHLVQDEMDDIYLLKRSLGQQAYALGFVTILQHSNNGATALDMLDDLAKDGALPDLLIVDLNMPGMDGLSFIKAVKADNALRAIPVIMITATDDTQMLDQMRCEGADDVYAKPYSTMARDALCADVLKKYTEALPEWQPGAA